MKGVGLEVLAERGRFALEIFSKWAREARYLVVWGGKL
jgi:hypothetical protein